MGIWYQNAFSRIEGVKTEPRHEKCMEGEELKMMSLDFGLKEREGLLGDTGRQNSFHIMADGYNFTLSKPVNENGKSPWGGRGDGILSSESPGCREQNLYFLMVLKLYTALQQ